MAELSKDLSRLIAAVGEGAAAMEKAALRVERAREQRVNPAEEDLAVVTRWLRTAARVAALSCDQPNPLSKELGARLDAHTTSLDKHLNR